MLAILLSGLFTTAALLALATIATSWRRYGRTALALRAELAACPDARAVDVRITELTVRASATVLRPDFTARGRSRSTALPAAA